MFVAIGGVVAIIALLALSIFLITFALYQSSRRRVGYIPLPRRAVPAVVEAFRLHPDSTGIIYDLGCGDGRILAAILRDYPNLHGVGVELHPLVAMLAGRKLRSQGLADQADIIRRDLMRVDLSDATHLFTYLNPPMMTALEAKLDRELKPGARLVSCDFPLPNHRPSRTIAIGRRGQLGQKLYVYDY